MCCLEKYYDIDLTHQSHLLILTITGSCATTHGIYNTAFGNFSEKTSISLLTAQSVWDRSIENLLSSHQL